LEGPFINIGKYGAHRKDYIIHDCKEGIKELERVYSSLEHVKIITVAPELEGMAQTIPELKKRGIVVSAGRPPTSH
jgi:N-acetylglucosamine-6-phosphate deacetylase